ncbi:hypothetical protein M0802_008099 [Mischocyttarus mexicanus]|nr:hypothetical protein M0802_008099 [Mischocyttarus mexicanus]
MFILMYIYTFLSMLVNFVHGSSLTTPPLSVLMVGFEDAYDLSLLANTLSDQGIDVTLIIPEQIAHDLYENLIDVEVYQLKASLEKLAYPEDHALKFCESLLKDQELSQKVQELQAAITLVPALRHDGCLLPWIKSIGSIPVILTRNANEEVYAFERTGVALPILKGAFWSRISTYLAWRSKFADVENNYVTPVFHLVKKHLPNLQISPNNLYSDPLPEELQKLLIEHRLGSVVVLLDGHYKSLIKEIAQKLPQGRQGHAVVWKVGEFNFNSEEKLPVNLYPWQNVDRQDLIGNGRTRVVLSHCTDIELLEIAFHGSPVICFPRNAQESKNGARAVELGFAHVIDSNNDRTSVTNEDIISFINTIYSSTDYRENARRISVAIRDRLNPASDRLIYWLRYIARTKGDHNKFLVAPKSVSIFYEDFQLFLGFCTGAVIGVLLTGVGFLLRYIIISKKMRKSKGRYER